jgi:hypothetical protein
MTFDRFARVGYDGRWHVWYGEDYGDGLVMTGITRSRDLDLTRALQLAALVAGPSGRVSWHSAVAP